MGSRRYFVPRKASSLLRWAAMVPTAVASWFVMYEAGLYIWKHHDQFLNRHLNIWTFSSQMSALSAVVVVGIMTLVAPSHKREVALWSYLGGATVALALAFTSGLVWEQCVWALAAGAIACLVIRACIGMPPNTYEAPGVKRQETP